jgi:hypothetical protein
MFILSCAVIRVVPEQGRTPPAEVVSPIAAASVPAPVAAIPAPPVVSAPDPAPVAPIGGGAGGGTGPMVTLSFKLLNANVTPLSVGLDEPISSIKLRLQVHSDDCTCDLYGSHVAYAILAGDFRHVCVKDPYDIPWPSVEG